MPQVTDILANAKNLCVGVENKGVQEPIPRWMLREGDAYYAAYKNGNFSFYPDGTQERYAFSKGRGKVDVYELLDYLSRNGTAEGVFMEDRDRTESSLKLYANVTGEHANDHVRKGMYIYGSHHDAGDDPKMLQMATTVYPINDGKDKLLYFDLDAPGKIISSFLEVRVLQEDINGEIRIGKSFTIENNQKGIDWAEEQAKKGYETKLSAINQNLLQNGHEYYNRISIVNADTLEEVKPVYNAADNYFRMQKEQSEKRLIDLLIKNDIRYSDLSATDVKNLLDGKETKELNLRTKGGHYYNAKLSLIKNEDGSLSLNINRIQIQSKQSGGLKR
ncbi:MAG: hypothetical protein LBS16_07805 [Prevotellaceae bacterium]|nr:hypothetical protein [Prevotellaceae bacterium]